MKRLQITLLLLCFFNNSLVAQNSAAKGLLERISGKEFKELPVTAKYPRSALSKGVVVVPSITLDGDTSGLVYQKEYVLFRNLIQHESLTEKAKFISTGYVTNAEFFEFKNYVRDSLTRERIYSGLANDDEASKLIIHPKTKEFDPSARQKNRKKYPLNWKVPFSYTDPKIMPLAADLYLPQPERIYKLREFDERKWMYAYELKGPKVTDNVITSVFSDKYVWALNSLFSGDEAATLALTYEKFGAFSRKPVVSLNGQQAAAFCIWKQKTLQTEADKRNLKIRIVVTLPLVEDLRQVNQTDLSLKIEAFNHTRNWKITNAEYQEFTNYVQDSVLKEYFYSAVQDNAKALALLQSKKAYFDEGGLEFADLDIRNREENRWLFTFKSQALSKQQKEEALQIWAYAGERDINFLYYDRDVKRMAYNGKLGLHKDDSEYWSQNGELYVQELDEFEDWDGKDLNLDYTYGFGYSFSGVRAHSNIARFTRKHIVSVMEASTIKGNPKDAAAISYEQALAYYNWKFNVYTADPRSNWQNFILPSKEQFEKVQRGESIIIPAHDISYPGNVFRYVVHIYEK